MSVLKYFIIFIIGGAAYAAIEITFRGYTHWSMVIAGGICFVFLYMIALHTTIKLWQKAILGGLVITAVEFIFGIVFNKWLDCNIWDYSHHRFNLYGQICLSFSVIWAALSIPAIGLCTVIDKYIFEK